MKRPSPSPSAGGEGVSPLLEVRGLSVRYRDRGDGLVSALDGVSFDLAPGEVLGVLGESGGGKSSLALAILGLLPAEGRVTAGSVRFRGRRLDELGEREMEKVRGAEISLVHQEPALALHPLKRVGDQVREVLRAHRRGSRREAVAALLAEVGLGSGDDLYGAYPHQLSGGQRQRVVIAQALACRPAVVVADEPTAALDAATQARILELLRDLKRRLGVAFLYISHDPDVLAEVADRLLVLYAGRVVEEGPAGRVLGEPLHPYSEALLACPPPPEIPDPGDRRLPVIPGEPPAPGETSPGCVFAPRCPRRMPVCDERKPPALAPRPGRRVWCFAYEDAEER